MVCECPSVWLCGNWCVSSLGRVNVSRSLCECVLLKASLWWCVWFSERPWHVCLCRRRCFVLIRKFRYRHEQTWSMKIFSPCVYVGEGMQVIVCAWRYPCAYVWKDGDEQDSSKFVCIRVCEPCCVTYCHWVCLCILVYLCVSMCTCVAECICVCLCIPEYTYKRSLFPSRFGVRMGRRRNRFVYWTFLELPGMAGRSWNYLV